MKKIFLLIIASLISFAGFAKFVDYEKAVKVATAQYYGCMNNKMKVNLSDLEIICASNPILRNAENRFYVFDFNYEDNLGYVIVSSDDNIKPILAYSLIENFDDKNIAPALKMFFDYYNDCIEQVSSRSDLEVDEKITSQWDFLSNYDYTQTRAQAYESPLLLKGINWNQPWPYNAMCPKDQNSTGNGLKGHSPVGCVAVAACQIMKYYNWPPRGKGEFTHTHKATDNVDNDGSSNPVPGYGTFTVNFGEQNYNWDRIPGKASNKQNDELAKICFHLGVAIKMGWGTSASGAWPSDVVSALKKYFYFSNQVNLVSKFDYSDDAWEKILKDEIDARRPMLYSGFSSKGGHAWNCDGYKISETGSVEFHMNWGWGGSGNNYCTLDNLVAASVVGGAASNFKIGQDVVRNIYPRSFGQNIYPKHFTGIRYISGQEGSFDDGSGAEDYKTNRETITVLRPSECGSVVEINFSKFDIAEGDKLLIFEGDLNDRLLLDTFTKNKPPGDKIFKVNKVVSIKFKTAGIGNADGWSIAYKVSFCDGNALPFRKTSGQITDGSGDGCKYEKGLRCLWRLMPEAASKITINFSEFDLAEGDYLKVFKTLSTNPANMVAEFNSNNLPSGNLIVEDSTATLRFYVQSNSSCANGWKLSYVSENNSIYQDVIVSDFELAPNPGDDQARLIISTKKYSKINISITNILGNSIANKELILDEGKHEFAINEILNKKLENGIYFISLSSDNNIIKTIKFVSLR